MFAGLGKSTSSVTLFIDGIATSHLDGWWGNISSYLHLQNMNLTELPAGLFDGVEYLRELHLQGNRLRTLPEGIFESLRFLQKLDLSKNALNSLPAGLFARQYRIREIDLSQNCLRNSPDELFGQLWCQAFENFTCLRQT